MAVRSVAAAEERWIELAVDLTLRELAMRVEVAEGRTTRGEVLD